jgi:hypothetical protein
LGICVLLLAFLALATTTVYAQTSASQSPAPQPGVRGTSVARPWTPPRAPDGHVDLQGVWLNNRATPLERPKELEGRAFLTDEEVATLKARAARLFNETDSDFAAGDNVFLAALGNVDIFKNPGTTENFVGMIPREFDNRTSLIVDPPDGRVPPQTPEAQKRLAAAAAAARQRAGDGPESFNNAYRCITTGVPKLGGLYGAGHFGYYQIVQTSSYVAILTETIHDARIVPIDGRPHVPQSVRFWNGDSRGGWEDDTLVVETTNFSSKSSFMGSAEGLHLVERFARVADDTIRYEITITDPATWTRPWTAVVLLRQSSDRIYEWACHEGNRPMEGMLSGARADDKAAQESARTPK